MKMQKKRVPKDLRSFYQEAPIGLCSLDTNLRYLHINDWLAELNGLPIEAHLGRTIREVLPDVAASVEQQLRKVIETGEPILDGRVDAETPAYPGVVRNFQHHYHPIRSEGGRIMGVSCVVTDISERRRAEDALRQAHDELETRVAERTAALTVANRQLETQMIERKQSEEALVKSELRFRLVAHATFDAIWDWDMVSNLVEWNEGIQSLFGYEPDAVGQDVAWWIENVHPEDRTSVLREVHAVIENGAAIWSGEYRFRCYDGNYAIITDRGYVVHDETGKAIRMVGAMNDITERKQSEEILRASEERYRTLVDSSPSCIHEINLNGQLTSMNPAGLGMMGMTLESEVIGRPYLTAVTEEDQDRVGKLLALAYKGESSNFEFQAVNGRHFQSYFVPIDNNKGAIVKLMGLTQDVTEEKLAKEALRHLSGRVIKAQEEERGHIARELHDDIGQRLALMAVDIQLLSKADHQPKAAFREQMENLRSQIETLSSEVHNLSHQLHPANLEQLGLVTALKGFLREIQLNGMLSIEFSQKNVPVTIGDEISLCLYRIVQEAIRNVVKHSRATKAFIELIGEPDRVCLRIFDSGVGFNPERINGEKVGLGIVSMQERVRFLEGKINIQSQPDKGTQIDVEIPILS
jgi:PAS domain S-box-containing protein